MDVHVIVASKNRARDLSTLLTCLAQQTHRPDSVTVVGTCPSDVEGVTDHCLTRQGLVHVALSSTAGLCAQRNVGLARVTSAYAATSARAPFFVAFFDDDFRPAPDWIQRARSAFIADESIAGLTGCVLADGIHGQAISEGAAEGYLAGSTAPARHWATGSTPRELHSMYGCNMAFRDRVVLANAFDENLPLYGWQEDRDYTSRAKTFGLTIYVPECRGVHLGTKSGRVSGVRFGYSQVANPLYMWRKGTMQARHGLRFVSRHLLSNSLRSLQTAPLHDYRGRLRGNLLALRDLARGSCDPRRVLTLE